MDEFKYTKLVLQLKAQNPTLNTYDAMKITDETLKEVKAYLKAKTPPKIKNRSLSSNI